MCLNWSLLFQNYVPTKLDILHARKATKGIIEHQFDIKGIPFLFVDVGGQRSQRQKWFQCFEGITSILFLASSSEFDQVLMEDRKTNRLVESCDIFETIINNKTFSNVSIILFLNKTDLLEEKVKHVSIKDSFPEFEGDPYCLEDVQNFMLGLFDECRRERSKPLFHHFTTAIDTENIKFVFQAVKDTILQDNLKSLMLQWKSVRKLENILKCYQIFNHVQLSLLVSQKCTCIHTCKNGSKPTQVQAQYILNCCPILSGSGAFNQKNLKVYTCMHVNMVIVRLWRAFSIRVCASMSSFGKATFTWPKLSLPKIAAIRPILTISYWPVMGSHNSPTEFAGLKWF